MRTIEEKERKLEQILQNLGSALIAFSGGVDSTYLLYKARAILDNRVLAVTADSETYQEYEKENARYMAQKLEAEHLLIQTDELSCSEFASNPPQRCYYCKKELFTRLQDIARQRGLEHVCDGANFDDQDDFRPGHQAAREAGVRSPLMEAGITKEEIRKLSQKAELETWDLPAAACLASRIPYGEPITPEKLGAISQAESFLRSLGYRTLRVRCHKNMARIEVPPGEITSVAEKSEEIAAHLKQLGFHYITLDLEGYRSGSMNEALGEAEKKKA